VPANFSTAQFLSEYRQGGCRVTTKPASKPTAQGVRLAMAAAEHGAARVRRWFLKRGGRNPQEVEDLVQEVQLRLLRVSDDLLLRQPDAYILQVAASVLIDRADAHRKRAHIEHDAKEVKVEPEGPAGDDPAYRLQLRSDLDRAFARLPRTRRQVLLLCRRDGYSYEETADRLGLSETQVHRYLHEGTAQLRTLLWPTKGGKV
jgi:RNA polymerase sigma factor (sigma-70 family)